MKIVGVKLSDNGRVYFFDADGVLVKEDDSVIVETEKGIQPRRNFDKHRKLSKSRHTIE